MADLFATSNVVVDGGRSIAEVGRLLGGVRIEMVWSATTCPDGCIETLPRFMEKASLESQLINLEAEVAKAESTVGSMSTGLRAFNPVSAANAGCQMHLGDAVNTPVLHWGKILR